MNAYGSQPSRRSASTRLLTRAANATMHTVVSSRRIAPPAANEAESTFHRVLVNR